MVIIAAAAIILPLKQHRLSASHPCQNSPDHLVIVFVWPGKLTDAQVKFCFKLNLGVVLH